MGQKEPTIRLRKIAKKLNISIPTIVKILKERDCIIANNPNEKIDFTILNLLKNILKDSVMKERIDQLKQIYFNNRVEKELDKKGNSITKINDYRIIGIIEHEFGGKSARIKAVAYLNEDNMPIGFSDNEAALYLQPNGYIFEPSFFYNYKFQINDIVSFYIEENDRAKDDDDKFRLKVNASEIKYYGFSARSVIGFKKNNLATDLSLIKVEHDTSDGKFFGITDKYIIGELRIKNKKIEPALHHRIKIWDRDEDDVLIHNKLMRLHSCPEGESIVLDCMSDKQLFEWYRDELKRVEPDYVNILDKKARWRTEIPQLFSKADKERYEVDRVRFERINEKFRILDLSILDITTLIEKSNSLREVFNKAIEAHKEEWKTSYKKELEEYRQEFDKQKKFLDKELGVIQNSQKEKEGVLNSLKGEIESSLKKIESLNQNKERILADFSIIKDVLRIENNIEKSVVQQDSFILEDVEKPDNSLPFSSREEFVTELQCQLNKHQLFPDFAKRLLDVISIYKGVLIKDVRLGVAFAEATKNTNYIIQQVEPDWLHFSDFWNNGLGAIWQSAHKTPKKLHFLILEDINLSSPECYAKPLLDMINGIRKHIPYGKTAFPVNLRILATKASTADPEIGLPIIEQTFTGWGAVGFKGNIYKKSEAEYQSLSGFMTSETLPNFLPDEFEIEDIKIAVQQDLNNLFEIV